MNITIDQLTVAADAASKTIDDELSPHICRWCRITEKMLHGYRIIRRSVDARSKPHVKLLYRIEATIDDGIELPPGASEGTAAAAHWHPAACGSLRGETVVIVGAGPAGLFSALAIAMAGGHPVVVDRGRDVVRRGADIRRFRCERMLDTDSNYLFGEGGAGTWSDGKLFTRVNDPRVNFVLQQFIECGASPAIGYFSHPHIGSDRLPGVIARLREKIIALGGEFRWDTRVESLRIRNGRCAGVCVTGGETLEASATVVACGHSARKLIQCMASQGVEYQLKGFQIGMRLEHPQRFINKIQYGLAESYPALGAAEYNVVSKPSPNGRSAGVTSFCMCPGGEIIPAVAEEKHLCTNGMSNAARNSPWANAAIITTIDGENFPSIAAAYDFLERLEADCFKAGGGDYTCPAQMAADFVNSRPTLRLPENSFVFGTHGARLDRLLPPGVVSSIQYAMRHFDKCHPGFISQGLFLGVETRVSSPVRFVRRMDTMESSLPRLFLAGEGAGMAGGITSAAVDGLKMAEAIQAVVG